MVLIGSALFFSGREPLREVVAVAGPRLSFLVLLTLSLWCAAAAVAGADSDGNSSSISESADGGSNRTAVAAAVGANGELGASTVLEPPGNLLAPPPSLADGAVLSFELEPPASAMPFSSSAVRVLSVHDLSATVRAIRVARPTGAAGAPFRAGASFKLILWLREHSIFDERPMSISSSPRRPYVEFTTRRTPSAFKAAFFALRPGDQLGLMGPIRSRIADPASAMAGNGGGEAVLLAQGMGFTVFKSLLERALDRALNRSASGAIGGPEATSSRAQQQGAPAAAAAAWGGSVTLYMTTPPLEEVPWRAEMEETAARLPRTRIVHLPLRRFDADAIGRVVEEHGTVAAVYQVAGSPAAVRNMVDALVALGVQDERIRRETYANADAYERFEETPEGQDETLTPTTSGRV